MKALKLRYNELTMLFATGLVRALSDSVNSKIANLTVKCRLHAGRLKMKHARLAVGYAKDYY